MPESKRRLQMLGGLFGLVFLIFVGRLFDLQVLHYEEYAAQAKAQHEKRSVLPARRGKILVRKNQLTDETTSLATNNTLKMLFVDPLILAYPKYNPNLPTEQQEPGNPALAAEILAPILIHAHCEAIEGCEIKTDISELPEIEQVAVRAYQRELENIFTRTERTRVILETQLAESRIEDIRTLNIPGIAIEEGSVIADPTRINDTRRVAELLEPLLNIEASDLEPLLQRRPVRYREITKGIVPEIAEKIESLKALEDYRYLLRGVRLQDEYRRYYPEKNLASQILGFVDGKGNGQYGIEGRFDLELRGKEGLIFGATNTRGQRILGRESQIQQARDGADILLSIDRVIQGEVERILADDLKRIDADFGQVVVLDPQTGRVLAMAHAPTFNPNEYGKVYLRYEVSQEQEEADRADEFFNQKVPTIFDQGRYYRYFNLWGPQVFRNKIISDIYEPGSVIKAITIAAGLNANEITPKTLFDDDGPIEVDEFTIRNSDEIYGGPTTMITVLNRSLNTGIAFITRKMGAQAVYQFLKDFGFGQYTDVDLDGEVQGNLEFWRDWAESELITRGYGQGFSASPLQTAMAFASLANGGYLMKPLLVEEIRHSDGRVEKFYPEKIRRVISDQTYHTIKSMLLNGVNNGIARGAQVYGHTTMGKTGTSQTYDTAGRLLTGEGTTITSFAGFGPFKEPKFVILVKYDFPKVSQWGSETAAPTFRRIAEFLFRYYNIPPDK